MKLYELGRRSWIALTVLLIAVSLTVGCKHGRKKITLKAAQITVRGVNDMAIQDLAITIDPANPRAKVGDTVMWAVTVENTGRDTPTILRAVVMATLPDSTRATVGAHAELLIVGVLTELEMHAYIADRTSYAVDSAVLSLRAPDGTMAPIDYVDDIGADADGNVFLRVTRAELEPGCALVLEYGTTVLPASGVLVRGRAIYTDEGGEEHIIWAPPAMPGFEPREED